MDKEKSPKIDLYQLFENLEAIEKLSLSSFTIYLTKAAGWSEQLLLQYRIRKSAKTYTVVLNSTKLRPLILSSLNYLRLELKVEYK